MPVDHQSNGRLTFLLSYTERYSCGRDDLIWAQILAVIALIISVAGWWLAWAAGVVAVVILLLDCCCVLDHVFFLIAGIAAMIAAIGEFLVAAAVVEFGHAEIHADNQVIMAIIAGVFWVFAAVVAMSYGRGFC
jgi:hypothetical protein